MLVSKVRVSASLPVGSRNEDLSGLGSTDNNMETPFHIFSLLSMPALRIWGGFRFALIAGDDLRVLSLLAFVYRFFQAVLLIPAAYFLVVSNQETSSCQGSHQRLFWAFWSVSAATVAYSLFLEGIMYVKP